MSSPDVHVPARSDNRRTIASDRRLQDRRERPAGRIAIVSILVVAVLYLARPVIIPIALAILLAFLLTPVVNRLERTFLRRSGASIVAVAITVVILGLAAWSLTVQVASLAREVNAYSGNVERKLRVIEAQTGRSFQLVESTIARLAQTGQRQEKPDMKVRVIENRTLADRYERIAPTAEALTTSFLVVVLVFFLLQEREKLRDRLLRLAGRANVTVTTQAIGETVHRISRFLLTQALLNLGFGIVIGGSLFAIGVPHAALWGVLAALLRFIPFIGAVISAVLPTLLAFAVFPGWFEAIGVLAIFILCDQLMAGFIEPLVIGGRVGVSPVALLVATIFWGWLWGPVGLLMAVPITVLLTVGGEFVPALQVFSTLFGTETPLEDYLSFYNRLLSRDRAGAISLADRHSEEHSMEATFIEMFVPTLSFASEELGLRRISSANDHFIKDVIRELVIRLGDRNQAVGDPTQRVIAASVGGERISFGTLMLVQILRAEGYVADAFTDLAHDELFAYIKDVRPEAVFVSCSNPKNFDEGLSLVAELRRQFPELPLFAAGSAFVERTESVLEAGASFVPVTLESAKGEFFRIERNAWSAA